MDEKGPGLHRHQSLQEENGAMTDAKGLRFLRKVWLKRTGSHGERIDPIPKTGIALPSPVTGLHDVLAVDGFIVRTPIAGDGFATEIVDLVVE